MGLGLIDGMIALDIRLETVMRTIPTIRAAVIAMALLPGLALAAPTAGPCGYCDRGMTCPSMVEEAVVEEAGTCCGNSREPEPVVPSDHLSKCDCGQPVPPAVGAEKAPSADPGFGAVGYFNQGSISLAVSAVAARTGSPPHPPPSTPIYLIDCVSLT
jgi:hypothetical protein